MMDTQTRRTNLAALFDSKRCLRVLEAHSPISALLAERARLELAPGHSVSYDAIWSSSLTDSTQRGLPDIEILSPSNRLHGIREIFDVCSMPLIFDGDTGGKPEHFAIHIKMLERAGVSAVVIEDKCGLKKNSLFGNAVSQEQESIEEFCEKIRAGCASRSSRGLMIIARCESLILDRGMDDAIARCLAYVEAGADGIMIHSRKKDGLEILEFARLFRRQCAHVPLICVPTSYSHLRFEVLEKAGFNAVIYANHMLRSAYLAMRDIANGILANGRTLEMEPRCLGIEEILDLVPGTR
ncbi:phosphoenolpyruvate mutase [Pseudomonas frederiksbergensis]|uniref:phosphoenolpyruvate mutase n=1 Tax=Pseudomonas frederiksbergensis TaxID=104087 RepID=A0A423KRA0_9PSED|nr:phosphoenolpyruvate mutase [Pseudomonas frederiksbergensis]RON57905.1 phosphoenolpyruvate mutase [Pseudomonas frederiksbergensis]